MSMGLGLGIEKTDFSVLDYPRDQALPSGKDVFPHSCPNGIPSDKA
jgi:hypothetical protein